MDTVFITEHALEKNMDDSKLLDVRESWYEAFFSGNTRVMDEIEAESFLVVNEHGVQTKREQLHDISVAREAGQWFPVGSRKQDTSLAVRRSGSCAVISGSGLTLVGGRSEKDSVLFSEVWCNATGAWQVLHLHYMVASNG